MSFCCDEPSESESPNSMTELFYVNKKCSVPSNNLSALKYIVYFVTLVTASIRLSWCALLQLSLQPRLQIDSLICSHPAWTSATSAVQKAVWVMLCKEHLVLEFILVTFCGCFLVCYLFFFLLLVECFSEHWDCSVGLEG